jgi:hypothetical protein
MLLKQKTLKGIADGSITLAFRRWKRPTVKAGGSLRTVIGVLAIESVDTVDERKITTQDAKRAGYESRKELLAELNARKEGKLYRIALHHAGADPRHDLRQQDDLSDDEIDDLKNRLARMDTRSSHGPWTTATLKLIAKNPGKRAADMAESVGMETKRFKTNVRKLKELGLTESLQVGYRLSPRGEVVFEQLRS